MPDQVALVGFYSPTKAPRIAASLCGVRSPVAGEQNIVLKGTEGVT